MSLAARFTVSLAAKLLPTRYSMILTVAELTFDVKIVFGFGN